MSTDGQGRPLSDDGQWAWNGTEWVPAAMGGGIPPLAASSAFADPNATVIAASPFPAAGGQPTFGSGAAPGYGADSGFGGAGAPPAAQGSRRKLIIGIAAAVIVIAVVAVLIVTLSGGKKAAFPGAYVCTKPGSSETGIVTFQSDGRYTLNRNGKAGTYVKTGNSVVLSGGTLDKDTGVYNPSNKTVTIPDQGSSLTCKAGG
jgi:hypothetical protein